MLSRLRAAAARRQTDAGGSQDARHVAEAHAFLSEPVAAMPLIAPIAPANDDPMAGMTEIVELELRAAGHLR